MKDVHEKKYQIEGGFPVEINFYEENLTLEIHSETSRVSGGDWGSGYRYSYDWKLEIPVYENDWETAERKAVRRYEQHVALDARYWRIVSDLEKLEESDGWYSLISSSSNNFDEKIRRLKVAGFAPQDQLFAEEKFLNCLREKDWEEASFLVESFDFSLPEDWQDDWFDDLVIEFLHQGCQAGSEECIEKLLRLDAAKARKLIPAIALQLSKGERSQRPFISFLEEKEFFGKTEHVAWSMIELQKMIGSWAGKMWDIAEHTVLAQKQLDKYYWVEKRRSYEKDAIILWQQMGEWCLRENIGWKDVQATVRDYIDSRPVLPPSLDSLRKAFRLPDEYIDGKIVEFLAINFAPYCNNQEILFQTHGQYMPAALKKAIEEAKKMPDNFNGIRSCLEKFLDEKVAVPSELKKEAAEILIRAILAHSHWEVEKAFRLRERFGLETPELDRLEEVFQAAEELAKEEALRKEKSVTVRGILQNREASNGFKEFLNILARFGPSPAVRISASQLEEWLEYEIQRSFPHQPIVVDVFKIMALATNTQDVAVGLQTAERISAWLQIENQAAKNYNVVAMARGLIEAVEEVGSTRRTEMIEYFE